MEASIDPRCSKPLDAGTKCDQPEETRYGYKKGKGCVKFHYYGCGGNMNNFGNEDSCKRTCSA
ncbi:Kunitz/Bovine pancreatic trypsin inhibitor domain protein [Ancylostoma duodenale]|uniref:Kunitz/Bovine pancreatic trypsin inhibitor domain protein n=1 Tax=Ancylostoma duodenale TaxID=51022 RepID=A0A0C2GAL4_9BILA|nr:Kunitz/Bovine pancreatic trypsin inhibitor domain protein [Ancylostoma duodenale]